MSKQRDQNKKSAAKTGVRRADRRTANEQLRAEARGQRPNRWEQQAAMQERQRF